MRRTAYVESSDGLRAAFYVDGTLALQGGGDPDARGHLLPAEDLFPVLDGHGLLEGYVEASAGEYDTADDPGMASLGGRFPERLADLEATGRVSWSI